MMEQSVKSDYGHSSLTKHSMGRYYSFLTLLFYFIPSMMVLTVWAVYMTLADRFHLLLQHWELSLTMVAGSLVAGATSEGGGAVAFPIFTKVLSIPPHIARTFALAIQMVGMGTASIVIIKYRIPVIMRAILYASLGGVIGMTVGTLYVAPFLKPAYFKIAFTILTAAFGFVLFMENRKMAGNQSAEARDETLEGASIGDNALLFGAGIVGGLFGSIVGTGIDFLTFAVLVLYFNISEKVATPTSVILMAVNSTVGFILHAFFLDGFKGAVMDYWLVCIPVVIFGAPTGALICARISRENIIRFLLFLIAVEFVSTLWLVKFDTYGSIFAPVLFVSLVLVFFHLNRIGRRGNR